MIARHRLKSLPRTQHGSRTNAEAPPASENDKVWAEGMLAVSKPLKVRDMQAWEKHQSAVEAYHRALGDVRAFAHPRWSEPFFAGLGDDDEPVVQGYLDHYAQACTCEWSLDALESPAALAHPEWAKLFQRLCKTAEECAGTVANKRMERFLLKSAVRQHPRFKEILGYAKAEFPYAVAKVMEKASSKT